ncbi:MAG: hypothetical protein ACOH5I_06350 [Oligoflexus sp.]
MQAKHIDPQVEYLAEELFRSKNFASAEAAFHLLCNSFPNYAEGYNYLGLIYLKRSLPMEAVASFRKAVEVGRKLFPKRLAKSQYWLDLRTRPYIRGLSNLCLSLIRAGLYEEALDCCDLLEKECQETARASYYRSCIYLNLREWQCAEIAAVANSEALEHVLIAFAQFEQGKFQTARVNFIYALSNHPFAVLELMAERGLQRSSFFEEEDFEQGRESALNIAHYLARHSRKSRDFFKKIMANPVIRHHLDNLITCSRNHFKHDDGLAHKDNFTLWKTLKSYDHACKIAASSFRQAEVPDSQVQQV